MVVFFLQYQLNINVYGLNVVGDFGNVGKVFVDFVKFYGSRFDNAKFWIFIQNKIGEVLEQEEFNAIVSCNIYMY